jgi:hypothetical protein
LAGVCRENGLSGCDWASRGQLATQDAEQESGLEVLDE